MLCCAHAQELLIPIQAPQAAEGASAHAASGDGAEATMQGVPAPTVAGAAARAAALGRSVGDAEQIGDDAAPEQQASRPEFYM